MMESAHVWPHQMAQSMTAASFDQAWDVWVDRTAILVSLLQNPVGSKSILSATVSVRDGD